MKAIAQSTTAHHPSKFNRYPEDPEPQPIFSKIQTTEKTYVTRNLKSRIYRIEYLQIFAKKDSTPAQFALPNRYENYHYILKSVFFDFFVDGDGSDIPCKTYVSAESNSDLYIPLTTNSTYQTYPTIKMQLEPEIILSSINGFRNRLIRTSFPRKQIKRMFYRNLNTKALHKIITNTNCIKDGHDNKFALQLKPYFTQ